MMEVRETLTGIESEHTITADMQYLVSLAMGTMRKALAEVHGNRTHPGRF